mgnify:FL=1
MNCPKCKSTMQPHENNYGIKISKCGACKGMWFPDGSAGVKSALPVAKDIDTGVNAGLDEMKNINCPECSGSMIDMVDSKQHHIRFESCGKGCGVFLDAGELVDLSEFTLIERVKQLIGG